MGRRRPRNEPADRNLQTPPSITTDYPGALDEACRKAPQRPPDRRFRPPKALCRASTRLVVVCSVSISVLYTLLDPLNQDTGTQRERGDVMLAPARRQARRGPARGARF